ncbi:hypothetical protein FA13DRAFT_1787142 [Coprinellus micaceus]|uniref:Uncharacterized protein n=1 Tax=Coprinellus micaceus TaxID=71717 RepID=A0A4Y7TT63_COPMI|nr:hypothetical protein FA13DRAFT_1787142 [Coprinellus micaceus]
MFACDGTSEYTLQFPRRDITHSGPLQCVELELSGAHNKAPMMISRTQHIRAQPPGSVN